MSAPDSIAHYRITSKLGQGGMGEVYRATDTRLGREVAIKVLPPSLANDAGRMARFEREAQMLAALNHPNIAAIYGIEQGALVMELVEGEDLKGPAPVETALAYARQIAEGLEAAHEKGIIHRDLKPANIKVTPSGQVKILDFGLAKPTDRSPTAGSATMSPTLSLAMTQEGMILGTAAYMSPEQARGKPVDKRADIWAFGVVLFEMLTGRSMFGGGETVSDSLAAVITKEPDWTTLPKETPPRIRRLLERCLRKDPRQRVRDIGEARQIIDEPEAAPIAMAVPGRSRISWAIAAVATLAALMFAALYLRRPAEEARVIRFQIPLPEKSNFTGTSVQTLSPDGRHLAFAANTEGRYQIWIRDLDSLVVRRLPGTEDASYPFWSPDSRSIAFFAAGHLKKIDLAGGPSLTVCDVNGARGGSWSENGVIVFSRGFNSGIWRVPAAGGTAAPVTTIEQASGEAVHSFPWFLPDGHRFLYLAAHTDREKDAIWVSDLNSTERRRVTPASSNAAYSPTGFLVFARDRTLMAQRFDAASAKITGDAVVAADPVDFYVAQSQARFSVSSTGVLVYSPGGAAAHAQLTWFDRSGKPLGTLGPPGDVFWPAISPDGKTVAVYRTDAQNVYDVWLHDSTRDSAYRLTAHPKGTSMFPLWSPDGAYVSYFSDSQPPGKLYRKAASGAGGEEVLLAPEPPMRADDWSRDGRYLVGETGRAVASGNLWVLPLSGDGKPRQLLHSEFRETQARISPDSRWVAYATDRTTRNEVYVTSFPTAGAQTQISTAGGRFPVWSADGKELFYLAPDGSLMAVPVKPGSAFEAGVAKRLFGVHLAGFASNTSRFDVSKDGRFLIPVELGGSEPQSMIAVVNWTAGLKQ